MGVFFNILIGIIIFDILYVMLAGFIPMKSVTDEEYAEFMENVKDNERYRIGRRKWDKTLSGNQGNI